MGGGAQLNNNMLGGTTRTLRPTLFGQYARWRVGTTKVGIARSMLAALPRTLAPTWLCIETCGEPWIAPLF